MTIGGNGTLHHNCTEEAYGDMVIMIERLRSSSIHLASLASPLTIETNVSTNNYDGGNYGGLGTIEQTE